MTDDKKKMTAQNSSVGADDGQSISTNSKFTIPDPDETSNSPERDLEELYRKMRRISDPAYLHTVTLDELMDNVFKGKSAVIENLLYTGAYILAGAPKIGKSFLVAQIATMSVSSRACGVTRFIRGLSSILLWKMTRAVYSARCSECSEWRGQAPSASLPTLK